MHYWHSTELFNSGSPGHKFKETGNDSDLHPFGDLTKGLNCLMRWCGRKSNQHSSDVILFAKKRKRVEPTQDAVVIPRVVINHAYDNGAAPAQPGSCPDSKIPR